MRTAKESGMGTLAAEFDVSEDAAHAILGEL
jgi:hypothetical protein